MKEQDTGVIIFWIFWIAYAAVAGAIFGRLMLRAELRREEELVRIRSRLFDLELEQSQRAAAPVHPLGVE